jgi:cytochrome c oxidase subunit 2
VAGANPVKLARRFCWLLLPMLAACSGVQSPLNPAGEQAGSIYGLFGLMLWVCGVVYGAVMIFLGWSIWRARHQLAASPAIEPADPALVKGLWLWAGVIVAGLAVLAIGSFLVERGLSTAREREALQVRVTGHQWWWRIQYRDPVSGGWIETANELHLPAGRTARITLGSADVIHSFWVPNVAGKMDVIPGRTNVIDVSPHRIGWFRGQCAEFCGAQHAHMAFDVKVDSPADFAMWLATQARPATAPADPAIARGMAVVTGGQCAACHVVRGTTAIGKAGPDLTHIGARRSIAAGTLPMSRGALQGWIAQPQALKPGTMMPAVSLTPADADAVSRYLVSLQ